jgi:hypothetical protein
MSIERKKVLEMLAEGKITAEDAERLLDKLEAAGRNADAAKSIPSGPGAAEAKAPRFLRVVVDSPDSDRANIRVPLSFVRAGMKIVTVLPSRVTERLAEKGIDLSGLGELRGEELDNALRELNVDVDSHDGKKVRVFCE